MDNDVLGLEALAARTLRQGETFEARARSRAGLAAGDGAALGQLPADMLRSGTSETLNWITAGGALSGLSFDLLDYIPAYRSPAGTGVGMAFATWNRDRAAGTEQETAA